MLPQKHVVGVKKWKKRLAGGVVAALVGGLISRTACFDAKVKNGAVHLLMEKLHPVLASGSASLHC